MSVIKKNCRRKYDYKNKNGNKIEIHKIKCIINYRNV